MLWGSSHVGQKIAKAPPKIYTVLALGLLLVRATSTAERADPVGLSEAVPASLMLRFTETLIGDVSGI